MTGPRERLRAGWISAATSLAVFSGKAAAFTLTGSAAIFSDAMESVVNVVAAALLVWSLSVAARPADSDHPYGHGKIEFFTAGFEGLLILVASVMIAVQAVRSLVAGVVPQQLGIGAALLVAASIANGTLGAYLVRIGRRSGSLALEADGRHVLADVWTSAGVLGGLALVTLTGWPVLDPLIALGVAMWVLREGVSLTRRSVQGLMDAADDDLLGELVAALDQERPPEWIDAHGLRAWRSGVQVHADLHLVIPRYWDVQRLHAVHDEIERRVRSVAGDAGDAIVHFDPCRPTHCSTCAVSDCPVRGAPYGQRPELTLQRATRGDPDVTALPKA